MPTVDQRLCETVCRAASLKGWGARIDTRLSDGHHRVTFIAPDGASRFEGKARPTKPAALTQACRMILPHLAS